MMPGKSGRFAFRSFQPAADVQHQVAQPDRAANKQLVKRIYTDAANRSGTTFVDSIADDVCWIVTGQYSWSRTFRGRDAVLHGLMGHFRSLFAARPRTVAHNLIAEGDTVVVEAKG
jgi:ketosteroid isomerase-like protein